MKVLTLQIWEQGFTENVSVLKWLVLPSKVMRIYTNFSATEFKKYWEEDFLLSEQLTEKNEAIHIYGSSSGLKILPDCSIWAADGTYKKCPNPFVQIYVIGGVLEGHFLPGIYCLLPDHSTESYSHVFEFNQSIVKKPPVKVIIDFELATLNA